MAQMLVVVGACAAVGHGEGDGGAGGDTADHARQYLGVLAVAARTGDTGQMPRRAQREEAVDAVEVDHDTRRHTVEYAGHRRPVALAGGGEAQDVAKCIHAGFIMSATEAPV